LDRSVLIIPEFNTIAVIVDILEDLGYKKRKVSAWLKSELGHMEYETHPSHVKFRTAYGTTGHKRYCILRIKGKLIHVHGSEIDCSFIDLADPRGLDFLRDAITSSEEPNGYKGKS
jgi:hypothetical protein